MNQFTLDYPETLPGLLKLSSEEFHQEMKFIIAGKLYDMGKLSCGKAAELAGTNRIDFLESLHKYGYCSVNIQDEQIDVELQSVRDLT